MESGDAGGKVGWKEACLELRIGFFKLTWDSALNVGCPPAFPLECTAGAPSPREDAINIAEVSVVIRRIHRHRFRRPKAESAKLLMAPAVAPAPSEASATERTKM